MTPEEKAVIEAALYLRHCIDARTAGDPPRIGRLLDAVDALIFSCPRCNAGGHTCPGDGNPIGHTQTNCGQHSADPLPGESEPPIHRKHDPLAPCEWCSMPTTSEWVPATLVQCLAGDHIRMGADETDVLRCSAGIWHADTSDKWQPRKWTHRELRMDLSANPGFQEYPPNLPCEILATPERKAVLLLQSAFPGSAVISSDQPSM